MTQQRETPAALVTRTGPLEWSSLAADVQEITHNRHEKQALNPRAVAAARLRRQRHVASLHRLGPAPLYHLLSDLDRGKPVWPTVEKYAALPCDFIKFLGGDKFVPAMFTIDGGRR